MSRPVWRWILGAFFVLAGLNHFLNPDSYLAMMPRYLPYPSELVWISGVAEIFGGLGVLFRTTRVPAGWGLMALLVAVFPANIQAALHGWPGSSMPSWVLWLRLPFQPIFIWCVYRLCIRPNRPPTAPR
jgi:uncharacterized membrane protein